jgi:hypothetical protein
MPHPVHSALARGDQTALDRSTAAAGNAAAAARVIAPEAQPQDQHFFGDMGLRLSVPLGGHEPLFTPGQDNPKPSPPLLSP